MNMRSIIYTLGWVLKIEGLFMALPVVTAAIYGEQQGFAYAAVMGLCLILGKVMGLEGFWMGNALAGFITTIIAGAYYYSGLWKKRDLLLKDEK